MSDPVEKTLLSPGRRVEIKSANLIATVYPIGIRHFQKYSEKIAEGISTLFNARITKAAGVDAHLQYLLKMIPYVMLHLTDLVRECTTFEGKVDVEKLPHWVWPPIIEAWLKENFEGEEKLGPWVAMAEEALTALTGKLIPISETLSNVLSRPATDSKTSSVAPKEAPIRTPDGVTPS